MFFVGCRDKNKLGIVDTTDGVLELYYPEQLPSFGVNIFGFINETLNYTIINPISIMTSTEYTNFKSKMGFKLYKCLLKNDYLEFISNSYIIGFHDIIYTNGFIIKSVERVFDYSQTNGLFVLFLSVVSNGVSTFAICLADDYGSVTTKVLPCNNWKVSSYPVGSGILYMNLYKDLAGGLVKDRLYAKLNYTDDNFVIIDLSMIDIVYKR